MFESGALPLTIRENVKRSRRKLTDTPVALPLGELARSEATRLRG
nr:MAG TPA: hypothetical protein [Caudoviricetes sp.]